MIIVIFAYLHMRKITLQNNYNGKCDQSILYASMKPIIYTVEAILLYK